MKSGVVFIIFLLGLSASASAQSVILKGDAAENFIHKYFPEAPIPGEFDGTFKCFVPAMGGRSNGEVSRCTLTPSK